MTVSHPSKIGTIGWFDLTVPNADKVRDFYKQVVGWTSSDVNMGDYSDYCMHPPGSDDAVAGVCHARGPNTDLPAVWLMYITVADLDSSIQQCEKHGGTVITPLRDMGSYGRMAVIRDPAGAVCAIIQTKQ